MFRMNTSNFWNGADTDNDTVIEEEVVTTTDLTLTARVILFDDDVHTFDEVINQIIKATGYSYLRARKITFATHSQGHALVYEGELKECLRISNVLEEINLRTQIDM